MKTELNRALGDAVVRRLAGDRSYRRGYDYYQHGYVESFDAGATSIRAVVRGRQDYTVTRTSDDGVLDYACDCPQGADGAFCKHCVAAALAWLNSDAVPARPKSRGKVKEPTLADAAKVLRGEDKDTLLAKILEWAKDDDRLHERLLQYARRRLGPESGAAAASQAFDRAVRVYDFVHYREASAWARGVNDAIDNISRLLEDGHAAAVVELCESALRKLVGAAGAIDDSDGHLGVLRDRLQDIHFRACQEAKPDPVALARRLLEWELHSELDVFYGAAERYARILGGQGLEEYRQLAEAEWEKVPVRTPKGERSEWGRYFHITHIMESLARASGDTEESRRGHEPRLVARLQLSPNRGSVPGGGTARQGADVGRERIEGLSRTHLRPAARVRRRRIPSSAAARRCDETDVGGILGAAVLGDIPDARTPCEEVGNWPEWRERALAEIRRRIAKAKEESRGQEKHRWMRPNDNHSQLVEIYLYERDIEAAWREAQAGGCSDPLWLRLAAAREKEYPADAAPIYLKQAEAAVSATRNGRHDDPVALLVKAAAMMKRMGESAEFVRHLEALRVKYKIKRNFIKDGGAEAKAALPRLNFVAAKGRY